MFWQSGPWDPHVSQASLAGGSLWLREHFPLGVPPGQGVPLRASLGLGGGGEEERGAGPLEELGGCLQCHCLQNPWGLSVGESLCPYPMLG